MHNVATMMYALVVNAVRKIVAAPTDQIDEFWPYVQRVLLAIAADADEPGICDAWVSDESTIGDFGFGAKLNYARIGRFLRVSVAADDFIWAVAKRIAGRARA
jgi:hypothetical protein